MRIKNLIIGNGFAGRSVAHCISGECLIVERGEVVDFFDRRKNFTEMDKDLNYHSKLRDAWKSRHAFNLPENLGDESSSEYILVDGGCSNHWDGLCFHLSEYAFDRRGDDFLWPFSLQDMQPYYQTAEQLLRISADEIDPEIHNPAAYIEGGEKWRKVLSGYFPAAYLGAQAHNLSLLGDEDEWQGLCVGTGQCALCPMDAKTRSRHIPCAAKVINGVMVDSLRFEGNRAVEALCITEDGPQSIAFDRVVVAAHGIESLKLLSKSNLPKETPFELFGHHYQDHAVAELVCVFPDAKIPYLQASTSTQVVIPELSGVHAGIEYTTIALMGPPHPAFISAALDINQINQWKLREAIASVGSILALYVLLEVPPEWDVSMSYQGGKLDVDFRNYHKNKVRYNQIISSIKSNLKSLGAVVLESLDRKHYLNKVGTHHLVGMLGMGEGRRAVVNPDFRLKGTDNVFVVGGAVFPRCGSRNPTLTITALALMLGEQLR